MGLETATSIGALNALWPLGSDPRSQGDDHLRLIKSVLKADVVPKGGGMFTGAIEVGDYASGGAATSASQLGAGGLKLRAQSGAGASSPFVQMFRGTAEVVRMEAGGSVIANDGLFRATGAKPDAVVESGTFRAGAGTAGASNGGFLIDTDGTGAGIQFFEAASVAASAPMFRVSQGTTATIRMQAGGACLNVTGSWGTIGSRSEWKTGVEPTPYGLEFVLRLRPRQFEWRDGRRPGPQQGFVVDELLEVAPEFVVPDEEGVPTGYDIPFNPILVHALQELAARVEALEASGDGAAA